VLPGVVALELVLAQNERVAVCVTRLAGYPTGFEFELRTLAAPGSDEELDPMLFGPHRMRIRKLGAAALPDDQLRFGVQFADGRKATSTGGPRPHDEPPVGPVMHGGGGGGGGGEWHQNEWVWPLPPAGPQWFVCEWPAVGIALTRAEIDAQTILDAAARARTLFPGSGSASAAGGSVSVVRLAGQRAQRSEPPTGAG
jgi:hypothetical protein